MVRSTVAGGKGWILVSIKHWGAVMSKKPARDRLAQAAFDLFDERGYEQTTVDDITERAGLGRTTFFRYYRSKEDVIFPDHDRLLNQLRERLASSSSKTALVAVSDAVRLVMLQYLEEGDVARRRYALTSRVPALRDREIVSVARYQRVFREFIASWLGDGDERVSLRAEVMAAAMVAAHNHVLRKWLRGESPDPLAELDESLGQVIALLATNAAVTGPSADGSPTASVIATSAAGVGRAGTSGAGDANNADKSTAAGEATDGTAIVAFRTNADLQSLISSLKKIVES
jgi:AcrR family transcriptional regulator